MSGKFKMIEFTCKMKMQIKIEDNMTEDEIKEKIAETFDLVHDFGANSFDEIEDYSAYMTYYDEKDIKILE